MNEDIKGFTTIRVRSGKSTQLSKNTQCPFRQL